MKIYLEKRINYRLILHVLLFFSLGIVTICHSVRAVEAQEWIIIPDKVYLYEEPDLSKRTTIEIAGYPGIVVGISQLKSQEAQTESQWIKIFHGQDHYFLPKALLIKKVLWSASDGNLKIGQEQVDRWNPLPFNYKPDDVIKLPQKWNYHPKEYPKYLRSEAAEMLVEMLTAAEKQNIHIRVVSAFRSAFDQRRLYLRKINQAGLDQILVAKPGHSEHQLGTTVDLCGLDPDYVLKLEFSRTKEGKWLQENAGYYGFKQSYTEENSEEKGYSPEPWHFRYIGNNISD